MSNHSSDGSLKQFTVFEVPIREADVATLRRGEGRAMRLVPSEEALRLAPMTGYDHFALYLYIHRARVRARRCASRA